MNDSEHSLERAGLARLIRERTPARLFVGRVHGAYKTDTQLELRAQHATACDAVVCEFDLQRDFPAEFTAQWNLFQVSTAARTKSEYLLNPRAGRELPDDARAEIASSCPVGADLQIVIGDGLSATAVALQVPRLLPLLGRECQMRGWRMGRPFGIRHCRVGVMNGIGELLQARVVVLLIGERPGLSAADSLSAYLAYRPKNRHTDADRNLVSNIHKRGVPTEEAAARIANLAAEMMREGKSGAEIKEPPIARTLPPLRS